MESLFAAILLPSLLQAAHAPVERPLPTARLALELASDTQDGPIWVWEQVEFGPCTGDLQQARQTTQDRRWTWLSARDGLRVGVCNTNGTYEIRLERSGLAPAPAVSTVFLSMPEGDLMLNPDRGRWLGDPLQSAPIERRSTAFVPEAEARYHAVRDAIEALTMRVSDSTERMAGVLSDPALEEVLWDGAESALWLDGPEGFGGGTGLDAGVDGLGSSGLSGW